MQYSDKPFPEGYASAPTVCPTVTIIWSKKIQPVLSEVLERSGEVLILYDIIAEP